VHDGAQQISLCIGNDVALATFDPLAGIKAAWPSALGRLDRLTVDDRRRWLRLPSSKPTRDFNHGFIDQIQYPAVVQAIKMYCTVVKGEKSFGKSAHWHPVVAMYWIASHTDRMQVLRGRPTLLGPGTNSSIKAHSASVQSLA
jgi:hypothetical protein